VNQSAKAWLQLGWRIVRPLLLAYLLVVLAMMLLESRLVYPIPSPELGDWNPAGLGHEDVWFESADGTRLHGWFVPHAAPKRAILFCHGNGEHVAFNADLAARLRDSLQASVFLFDYRGYGRSAGRPSEQGCIADGRAAQRWLAKRMAIEPDAVVLMGRSLGTAVAIALAAEEGAAALILENAFPSMTDVAALHHPWLPVRWAMDNRYDSLSRIAHFHGPVVQSHGTDDTLIPLAMGRRLFDAAPGRHKRWIAFPSLGHNSPWPSTYYADLAAFLDRAGFMHPAKTGDEGD
jgi:fermentation-respiration switch protein FrsA (DUF1100 family)